MYPYSCIHIINNISTRKKTIMSYRDERNNYKLFNISHMQPLLTLLYVQRKQRGRGESVSSFLIVLFLSNLYI